MKRHKLMCRWCGKPFIFSVPVVRISHNKGRIKIVRFNTITGNEYNTYYDGVVCSHKCAKIAKRNDLDVFDHVYARKIMNTKFGIGK